MSSVPGVVQNSLDGGRYVQRNPQGSVGPLRSSERVNPHEGQQLTVIKLKLVSQQLVGCAFSLSNVGHFEDGGLVVLRDLCSVCSGCLQDELCLIRSSRHDTIGVNSGTSQVLQGLLSVLLCLRLPVDASFQAGWEGKVQQLKRL